MKKNIRNTIIATLMVFSFYTELHPAQYYIGSAYSLNFVSFYDIKRDSTELVPYSFTPMISGGVGFASSMQFANKWGVHFEGLYYKGGSNILYDIATSTDPGYSFDYISLNPSAQYTFDFAGTSDLYLKAGVPLNIMIRSEYRTTTLSRNITNEVNRFDVGLSLGVGYQKTLASGNQLQLEAYSSLGFINVFQGMIAENGLNAKNILGGIKFNFMVPLNF